MKIKFIIFFLLLSVSGLEGISQSRIGYRQPAQQKAIPALVLETFNSRYPDALLDGWFVTHLVYWQNDYSSGWYADWYSDRTVVIYSYEKPSYYEVEFISTPGERSRAIYNLYGYWFETRSQIRGLPQGVIDGLNKTQYAGWKISVLKERIESPAWPIDIYRFQVSKGIKKRIVRMDIMGNIIQSKYLNE